MIKKGLLLTLTLTLIGSVFAAEESTEEKSGIEISQVDHGCKKCKPR